MITSDEAKLNQQEMPMNSASVPLSALVDSCVATAQSSVTRRSYDADLRYFKRHGGTISVNADIIVGYLATFAGTSIIATSLHRLIAIHRRAYGSEYSLAGGSTRQTRHAGHPANLRNRPAPSEGVDEG